MDQFADNLQKKVIFNMQQISEGNIDIAPAITDDKDEIGPALNKMINAIGSMSNEINRCCHAALEGNLSNRADENLSMEHIRKSFKASMIRWMR